MSMERYDSSDGLGQKVLIDVLDAIDSRLRYRAVLPAQLGIGTVSKKEIRVSTPGFATLTDNSGGTAGTTIAAIGAGYVQAEVRNAVASLAAQVNAITAALGIGGMIANGEFKAQVAGEVAFTATTHDIEADAATVQERIYVVCSNAAGTKSIVAGVQATGAGNAVLPAIPTNLVPLGHLRLAVAAGATPFNATTDDLDAAHLTDTYYNAGHYGRRFDADY